MRFASIVLGIWFAIELIAWPIDRYAIDLDLGEAVPRRWISWGCIHHRSRKMGRYFCLRLPFYDWAPDVMRDRHAFGQRVMFWSNVYGKGGWSSLYTFEEPPLA